MSTYFKVINLDKKQRGMLATYISDAEAQEMILQKAEAEITACHINPEYIDGFEKTPDGSWANFHRGYMHHLSKGEAGAIYFEACGNAWGVKGDWYGDRVVIVADSEPLFDETKDWPIVLFSVAYEDTCYDALKQMDKLAQSIKVRKATSSPQQSTTVFGSAHALTSNNTALGRR